MKRKTWDYPENIYLFKFNNRNTKKLTKFSKLTINTPQIVVS